MTNVVLRREPDADISRNAASPKPRSGSRLRRRLLATALAAGALTGFGVQREWVGAANGGWSVAGNWDPAGTPASNDVLKFADRGGYPSANDMDSSFACSLLFANTAGHPVTITGNPIKLNGADLVDGANNKAVLSARYAKDTVTIEPAVTRTGGNVNIMGTGSTAYPLVFKSTVSGWYEGGGTIFFDAPIDMANPYADWYTSPSPNLYFNVPGNKVSGTFVVYNDGTLHMGCANAFSSANVNALTIGGGSGTKNGTVNLHGYDQSVKKLAGGSLAANAYVVTSPTPATLRVAGSSNMSGLTVVFQGGAGFEVDFADKTLVCSLARDSSTTGTLAVTKGKLTLNGKWASARTVTVGAEGVLTLSTPTALGGDATVTVADGGMINIAEGCDCTIEKLVLPDVGEVDPGEWGSTDSGAANVSSALAGQGKIFVTGAKSAAVWAGDDANDGLAIASNWKVGGTVAESINVTGGGLLATIAESGSHATVDRAAGLDGLVLTAPTFSFLKSGDGVLGLGGSGISAAASETAHTYVFEPTVKLVDNQTWSLGGGNTLVLNGGLSGFGGVTKTGDGNVTLNADGGATGLLTFNSGILEVNADRLDMPLAVRGDNDVDVIKVRSDAKTIFGGKVTYNNGAAIQPSGTAVIEYAGGFSGTVMFRPKNTAKIVFSGTPATFSGTSYFDSGAVYGVEFAVAGNTVAGSSQFYVYNGVGNGKVLTCSVPWAFNYGFNLVLGCTWSGASVNCATLDIAGDQGLKTLTTRKPDSGYKLTVASESDSVLHVQSIKNDTGGTHNLFVTFTGGAGFACETAAADVNTIDSISTSTGRVCVASGTLTFAEGATWANASRIVVTGGRLCIPRSGIFTGREMDVELTGGVLELGSDLRLKVRSLKLGETVYTGGTFGAPGSGADVTSELFAGTGVLQLKTGMTIVFR